MVTSADLAGTLGVDWSPFQAGLDAAFAYAEAWGTRAGAVLALRVTVDTTSLTGATAGLDAVTTGATQAAAAQTSASAAGEQLAASLGVLNSQAQAAGTGVAGLAAQTLSADAALEALSSRSAGAQASMAGFTGGVSAETAALQAATAEMAAMTGASEALAAAQTSSAAASEASAAADAALVSAQLALAEAETAVSQGADLAAAASRNYATTLTGENEQILAATANLNANAAANQEAAAAMTEAESKSVGMSNSIGYLALGVGVAAVAVVNMGDQFTAQMSRVEGFAGVSHQALGGLSQDVLQASRDTGQSTTQIAQGLYLAASAGLSASDAMQVTARSAALAQAGFTDTKVVVDVTTSALAAYHLSASQAASVQDVLTATTVAGKQQFSDLAANLGKVLPLAAASGVSLAQLGASEAEMTQKGIGAGQATAALSGILSALEAPSSTTQKELAALGLSADDVRASIRDRGLLQTLSDLDQRTGGNIDQLKDLVPRIQGLRGVLADLGQTGSDYARILDDITNSTGRSQTAIDAYASSSAGAIARFGASAKADLTEVGQDVAGLIADFLRLPAPVRDAAITFPIAAAGIALISTGLGSMAPLVGFVGSAWTTFSAQVDVATTALAGEAVSAEAAEAATAAVAPELVLIGGLIAAGVAAFGGFSSSSDNAAESEKRLADATSAATTKVNGFYAALQQANTPAPEALNQLNAQMIAAETTYSDAQTKLAGVTDELKLATKAADDGGVAVTRLNAAYGTNIVTFADAKNLVSQLKNQQDTLNSTMATASADAGAYGAKFKELTLSQQNEAQASKDAGDKAAATAQQYHIAADSGFALSSAKTTLVNILKQESAGTLSASAVNQAYANSVKAAADPTTDWAKRTKELGDAQKAAGPDLQASIKLQQDMDQVVRGLPASYAAAVTGASSLTAAAGIQSSTLADNAGHLKDLQAAVDSEKDSSQQAAVVQQQLAQARQFAAQSSDQQTSSLAALQLLIDTSTGSTKSYAEEQQKLDQAYAALGPDAANLATQHETLASAFGITKDKTVDLRAALPELIQEYKDGTISATDFGNAINGIFSKPTQAELDFKARLADIKDALSGLNSELANSSYAERHIADLEKIVLQDQATGASASKLAQDQANLGTAIAAVSPQAAQQGKALADQVFALTNQRDAVQASLDKETAHRESLGATVTAQQALATGTALTTGQMTQAYQTYENRVTGTLTTVHDTAVTQSTSTGHDATAALTTAFAAGNPAILAAGAENATHYHDGLMGELNTTKTDATNAASQLAGAITMPDAYKAAGTTDGEAFGSAIVAAIDAAMRTAAQHVQAGGATIAGLASAAGTAGSRSTAGAGFNLTAGAGGFFYPTEGPITQGFGENGEQGIDIGVSPGTPLASGIAGKIVDVKAPSPEQAAAGLGYWVTIDAGNGLQEVIGHMDDIAVQLGDTVKQGQVIGVSGGEFQPGHEDTSISSGPHTEVQVLVNGGLVNPETVLGKLLTGSPQDITTAAAGAASAASAGFSGGALPASWYAAINAHESTLPLPSPGNPEPMFGFIPGAPGSVGTGYYTSGGTAAASASLGVAAGTTAQSLFPTVQAGEGALDNFWQQFPDAVAAVQAGDFPGFLQALAAHGYAGPGEAAGFVGQTAAMLGQGDVSAFGGQELPGAAPDLTLKQQASFQATQTRDAGAAAADVTAAQNQLDQLQSRLDDLTGTQTPAAYQQQAQAAVGSAQTAITAQQAVLAAAQQVQSDITSNVDDNTLKQDEAALASAKTQAGAADSAANSANSAWTKTSGEVTASLQAVQTEGEKSSAALSTLSQHNADVAAGQTDYPTKIGAAYQQSATTAVTAWTQVGTDIDALNTALANGADAATLKSLHTRLTSDTQTADSADKAASAAFAAWDTEYKAEAQARKDLDTAIRADVTNEVNLTATLATAWTKVSTSIEEVSQRMGPDFAVGSGMIVDLAHSSATAAADAYHAAQATVIQDEQALTGELSEQDRQRLTSKTSTDKDIAASALQSAQDQQKAFGLVADAFNAMNTNLAAAAKNRLGMDAAGYDAWTDQVLTSVGITTDATTRGEEAKLTAARTTYDAVVADSTAASQQLIKDQNDYNNAVALGRVADAARAETAVSADQTRISSDQAAATAIVQQYGTIQSAVDAAMKTQIDDAKTAAQAEITSLTATRDAALQGLADRKTALDALVQQEQQALSDTATKQKDTIDSSTATQIAGIQSQLDAEQQLKDKQQLASLQTAVTTATTADQRKSAEQALADFQLQLHDKVLQSQIQHLQDAATAQKTAIDRQTTLQKQGLTDQTTAQKDALDRQSTALKNLYDDPKTGLITVQQNAIKALDAANSAHYTKQEGDAVADAQKLLGITGSSQAAQASAIQTSAPQFGAAGAHVYGRYVTGAGTALVAGGQAMLGGATTSAGAIGTQAGISATSGAGTGQTGGLIGVGGGGGPAYNVTSPWFEFIGVNLVNMFHVMAGEGIHVKVMPPSGGGGAAGGLTVNVPITLNATQGGTPEQLANEVAKQVHDQVLAELNDLFGRGATLAGA